MKEENKGTYSNTHDLLSLPLKITGPVAANCRLMYRGDVGVAERLESGEELMSGNASAMSMSSAGGFVVVEVCVGVEGG